MVRCDLTGVETPRLRGSRSVPPSWLAIRFVAIVGRSDRGVYEERIVVEPMNASIDSWVGKTFHCTDELGLSLLILNELDLQKAALAVQEARGGVGPIHKE